MKNKFNYIFIILTYRNTDDLEYFLKKNKLDNSKIIVVNSYFDDESKNKFENIALKNECDFINIENKGYSYGNNIGIKYAKNNYNFNYLIISNADVEILKFDQDFLLENLDQTAIYAPKINTLTGKYQNPFILRYNVFLRKLFYIACKNENKYLKYIVYILNKIDREFFIFYSNIFKNKLFKIYSCHGSFIIINKNVIDKNIKLLDENMFLFQEEHFFARQCYLNKIPIYYLNDKIIIKHFEDGSASTISDKIIKYSEESYIYYYEYFNK